MFHQNNKSNIETPTSGKHLLRKNSHTNASNKLLLEGLESFSAVNNEKSNNKLVQQHIQSLNNTFT